MTTATWRQADYWAMLGAVLAAPGDDLPRLALADWLDDHGGAGGADQAEFIRLGCRQTHLSRQIMAGVRGTSVQMGVVNDRYRTLLGTRANYQSWYGRHRRKALMPMWAARVNTTNTDPSWCCIHRWEWVRGMAERVQVRPAQKGLGPLGGLARLVRCQPVGRVEVWGRQPHYVSGPAWEEHLWYATDEAADQAASRGYQCPTFAVIDDDRVWGRLAGIRQRPGVAVYATLDAATAALSDALIETAWEIEPFTGSVPRPAWLPYTFPRHRPGTTED